MFKRQNRPSSVDPAEIEWFSIVPSADGAYRTRSSSSINLKGLHDRKAKKQDWQNDFPEFPYSLDSAREIGYYETSSLWLLDAEDLGHACEAIKAIKPILLEAYDLVEEIPRYVFRKIYLAPGKDDPLNSNYLLLDCHPYTPTGKRRKFPASVHGSYVDPNNNIEARVHLFENGMPGKAEFILRSPQRGPMWTVNARLEGERLRVNRIARTDADGQMPTLFTLGKQRSAGEMG